MKKIFLLLLCTMCALSSFAKKCINVPEGERFDYDLQTASYHLGDVLRISNTDSTITLWAYRCQLKEPMDTTKRLNNVGYNDWNGTKLKLDTQWDMNNYFRVATFKSFEEYKKFMVDLAAYMDKNHDNYETSEEIQLSNGLVAYPAFNMRRIGVGAIFTPYYYIVFVDKANPNQFGQILRLNIDSIVKKIESGKFKDMQK